MPTKFDFVSPGIQLNEVDESVLPAEVVDEGPLLIGTALKGPAMKPIRVSNLQDFYTIFGEPTTGKASGDRDVWREGNTVNPGYAQFAAQAHLASETTPITFVRLVGKEASDRTALTGQAGWYFQSNGASAVVNTSVSAYGLFIVQSASAGTAARTVNHTGSLGAIFYVTGGAVLLSGIDGQGNAAQKKTAALIKSSGAGEFTLVVTTSAGEETKTISFDSTSSKYIRGQFNTNPQKLQNANNFGGTDSKIFLGETFEQAILDDVGGGSAAGDQFGIILALQSGSVNSQNFSYHLSPARAARTGWFINRGSDEDRLFRLISHFDGEYANKSISIQITDLRLGNTANPDSSFTVKILENGSIVESFSGCNLNPSSADYVGKKIGTTYQSWDSTNKKWNVRGLYPNKSDYVYIEMDAAVENQILSDTSALPVGFYGPLRHKGFSVMSGSTGAQQKSDLPKISNDIMPAYLRANNNIPESSGLAGEFIRGVDQYQTASFTFPSLRLTNQSTNQGANYPVRSIFGVRHIQGNLKNKDPSYGDILKYNPAIPEADDGITVSDQFERSFVFNLQEVTCSYDTGEPLYYFDENHSSATQIPLQTLINAGAKQFEAPMGGGFDGIDIFKTNPFSPNLIGTSRKASYVNETLQFALDSVTDKEVVEYDTLCMPGMTNETITNRMIDICEDRGDSMAIIDLIGVYEQTWENGGSVDNGSVSTIVTTAQSRVLDSSYAATYYPSVKLRDTAGGNGDVVIVPPSVAAIGAIAKSQGLSEPWFAPAGFNRGGINQLGGSQGPRVVGTTEHLSKADRDDLYTENINPIARFPASGDIVIFGQKTLQQKSSALDRINVRRLLLYLKRRIGKVSETILFDQNVNATWKRFKAQADRILSDVQSRLGIVEYKLVLDETTTTADLVDRNILYAKVMIKPARAIEYIVVDFVVTRSGIEL
jgi:hypothetical protein